MEKDIVNLYTAKRTMTLKDSNYCLSFIRTVWRGEVIMCVFNNLQKEISNIYCTQVLRPGDIDQLEDLIKDFESAEVHRVLR